jgi:hypothetical protein
MKDDEMPTHKTFKRRVRTRMTKTGESYTAARGQLLRKAATTDPAAAEAEAPAQDVAAGAAHAEATDLPPTAAVELPSSESATLTATGRPYAEWFAMLDAWGAMDRTHTEIARWLREDQGVDGWWAQNVTVGYERARGRRAVGQMARGYAVGVSRTIRVEASVALAAFTDVTIRERWLPGAPMTQRKTTTANGARFDWADPPSRIVVSVDPKGARTTVWVSHEQLPDGATADVQKTAWRARLAALKTILESDVAT